MTQNNKEKISINSSSKDVPELDPDWIEKMGSYSASDPYADKHILIRLWHDFVFEITWQLDFYVRSPIRRFIKGVHNLIKYRRIIWEDRWWDYSYTLELLLFKLKDVEENWGKNTHYVNDLEDKETLSKMVEDLEWMVNHDNSDSQNTDEYKKVSKRFFGRLDRNHRKFWD